jgi:chorismate mutase
MNKSINIETAISLVNKRGTTFETMCSFIYEDVKQFQQTREEYYLKELKDNFEGPIDPKQIEKLANDQTDIIAKKIQKDLAKFCVNYAEQSIDDVLDAMNAKRFKYKTGSRNLLVILSSMKELHES